jgi:hypothetical protein
MNTETKSTPTAAAAQDFTNCPNWGKGGSYVVDITNGQRVPVKDLPADTKAALTESSDNEASKSTKSAKESKRA